MNIALFGGSFNPVHFGHIKVARYLLNLNRFDKLLLMPCHISPLKQSLVLASAEHRIKMLELGFAGIEPVEISDYEVNRLEVSYTINTVEMLLKSYDKVSIAIGLDNFLSLHKWHRIDDLKKITEFLVFNRSVDAVHPPVPIEGLKAEFLDSPWVDVSSTEVREAILSKEPLDEFVPQSVLEYIYEHKLYQL